MTHKIKVQMFGNFRMDYNGAPFVAEKMHKESQFNRMMQALIHYSDCGIAKDKLEEIVIGERDIDAPHTALRVIVYKTKQKLAQLGLPGKNLIYLEGGIYYWTPDIEIEEDAAEFEKLYNEACALEKQMPQESESAETVCDERIKEIEDNMLELYVKALYLYKGEFLVAYTGETWIAQEARRYHTMFEKIINEAAYILRKRKQFKGLEKIGVYAAKVDPFNEWEELIMEAMVETRRYDEAEELYTDVVDYYLRECGIYPSSRLLEILEKYSNQMNHAHEILENIQEGMNEQEETERGGYFCSYPVFKGIYQASIRIMKRTRVPVYLMLCTLEDEEDRQVQSETKINKYSRQLKKCVGESIRYSDIYPDMLRVLYDRMTEDDYDVAQCGVSCFKADKPNVLEVNDLEIQRLDLDNVDNRKNLIIGLTGFTSVTAWAKLYSTKFIREHNLRFIEDVYYEDTHFSMLCVLLAKKYCKVQSALYYYFENTEGIIRSEISNAKIRDAKIIMDHIRQAIQSRKAELGNVIEQCYCEIQTFLLWHQYIEPYSRIETFMNRELDICKEEFLKSEPDIFNNPYVKFFSDDVVLKRMSRLRVTAKKMNNVCFLDNAIHICLGIHDKDGNYSVWAGTTMQSIVENTKAPIVFHILHDDTLNEINKNKLSFIADNSGNDIEFHHFNSDVFGTFADSMNRFAIGTMFRIMLPDIMPDLKKIIYLDSDLFVNTDIEELWNLNIDNYCLAAAQDCSTIRNWGTPYAVAAGQTSRDRYFNAGVLCMNLDNIRKNGSLFQQVIDYLNDNPRTWLPDQDALNAIFSGKTLLIDEKWNYFIDEARKNNEKAEKKIYHYAATLLMLHTNNEIDRAYYFTILRTPWGEQMEDGLLCNSMGRIVDRTGMLEKLLKKVTQNNIRLVFYGGENSSIRNAMRLLNRNFDSCEWHEHLKENEIICDDNTVYIVSAEADDGNGLEILANAGLENGENYFITQRFLHYTEGGFAL